MVLSVENIRLVGCRHAQLEDGTFKTYGNLYTDDGELYPFFANYQVYDNLTGTSAKLDIEWGTGKNGKWFRCELM